ncbi:MAG: hypothetical protein DME53_10450 [Verrucomicrobia bacterium]|nr:MAG: hypothetical protein DME53_10450 [Verrucomicrobiota bacterium]
MKKKSSSKSAFFNFRVLLLLCLAGTLLVLAAFAARPGGSARPQRPSQGQNSGLPQASLASNNNPSPPSPGSLGRQRESNTSFNLMEMPGPNGETVTTDKSDYMPGETVVISGSSWTPNQAVALHIDDSNNVSRFDASVMADAGGNISNSDFVVQSQDVGLAFTLTAKQGAVTAWTQFTDVVGAGTAPNGDPGGFEIDGNLRASASPNPITDWSDTTSGSGVGGILFETGVPKNGPPVTYRVQDPANCGNACDDSFSGGKLNGDPNTNWTWWTQAANNKMDMNNVYVHISTDANNDRWITASADRYKTTGDAYVDFELLQNTLTRNVLTGCTNPPCGNFTSAGPDGGRTVGDLLVTAQYGNGGSLATILIYRWQAVSGGFAYVEYTSSIPAGKAFVATTSVDGVAVPYGAFGGTTYVKNQFVEMSLDLTALIKAIVDPCAGIEIKTVMVKTKESTSDTATLVDMAAPIQTAFSAGFVADAAATNPDCSTGLGTVTGTFDGGIAPYQCKLDNGSFGSCTSPVTYNNVGSGSHTVTVKDSSPGGDCQKTSAAVTITIPTAISASETTTPASCNGGNDGSVTVTVSGGSPPYSVTVNSVTHTGVTGSTTFTGLASGTYPASITDAHSCPGSTPGVPVGQADALVVSNTHGTIACHGGATSVTISATGGTAPYTGTGSFTQGVGSHTYTVTDANSCTSSTTVTLTEPDALSASESHDPILCFGGTTTVSITAAGGTPPYSGDGAHMGVSAGPFSFAVTDAHGCSTVVSGNISEPAVLVASNTHGTIACNGDTTTVIISATGGTTPYTGTGSFQQGVGSHTYTVTDANGCTSSTAVTLTQPPAVTLTLAAGACSSSNNGSLTATFGGGTGPYQLKIDNGSFFVATSSYTFTGLAAVSHTVTVKDANGCTKSSSITVASCPKFCSLTQGAYGNTGGKYTYNGMKYTTTRLLQLLTSPASGGSLVVGVPGVRSLTITQSAVTCLDGDNSCHLARLPANTAPASLPSNFGDQTLNACGTSPNCQTNPAIPLQGNGQWKSTLLGQTVALTLNTRLDPTLPNLVLPSCVSIPASVLTALNNSTCNGGYGQTVAGLLYLANRALAGQSTCSASLSDITNAIDSINSHFDSDGNNNCPSCQQ